MAITTPAFATKLDDNQLNFGSSWAESTAKQMGQQINYLVDSVPLGTINAFAINLTGVSFPNPNIWQLCDGSEITQADSPMRTMGMGTRFTPDLTDKFLRGSTTGGQDVFAGADVRTTSGSPSANSGDLDANTGGSPIVFDYAPPHDHSVTVIPAHYTVAYFIKIN